MINVDKVISAFIALPLIVLFFIIIFLLCGCTYNVSLVHTDGTATDVIDNDQKPSTDISQTLTGIPLV